MTDPSHGPSRRGFLGVTSLLFAAGATGLVAPAAARAQSAKATGDFTFAHPGLLHSAADLARMKAAVAAQESPVHDGYLALAAHDRSKSTYPIQNTGQITSWGRGPANYQSQAVADSAAAYQNALMWCVTGDRAHADKARDILNAWSASLTAITGADGQLGSGLQGFKFVNAAELLRHSGYDGWAAQDIAGCERSFLTVWYPSVSGYMLYANGNWDLTAMQTILAIGVFCEDRTLFENALRFAAAGAGDGSVPHRIVTDAGQGQESGRDQGHEQLAAGLLADSAQVAWNQGVDLYGYLDNRVLANFEYAARYNLGGDVPFVPDLDRTGKYIKTSVSSISRGGIPPIYEMAYAHYAGVRGLDAPYTKQVLFRGARGTRVAEGGNDDVPSWGTLTYAGAQASPGAPTAPAGLFATGDDNAVTVSWLPSAWASTYTVRRATGPEGPYEILESDVKSPRYTDRSVRAGRTYYYTVSAAGSDSESASSADISATAGLPGAWDARDVGDVRRNGATVCDGERFLLEAGGADIGGTADGFRFAWLPLRGDGVITARVVWPLSSQYSKVGVMLRGSGAADAAHASMLIQGLPLHTWSGVWTTRSAPGGRTTGTGSTPVPPSQQQAITTNASFPISDLGTLPESATPLEAPYVEGAGDGYRLRKPYWVRVTRKGRRCTGSISPDGIDWTEVGSNEAELGRTVYAGLAFASCLGVNASYAETGTAAFDNVSLVASSGTVWGAPRPARTATDLRALAGADAVELAWTDPDLSARYTVLRAASADGPYETIATDVGPVASAARIRYADATGPPGRRYHYAVAKTNSTGRGPRSASAAAEMPTPAAPELVSPAVAFANRGVPFQYLIRGTHEPVRFSASGLPRGLHVDRRTGLISGTPDETGRFTVTARAANATGTATGSVALILTTPPPEPWSYGDLGDFVLDERELGTYGVVSVQTPGSTSYDDGTFTVRGAGIDLNVNGQGMTGQFVSRPVNGDCEFTARLVSRTGVASDRVGLLMAKSLSPFDQAAGAIVTSGTTAQLMLRTKVAGASAFTGNVSAQLPSLLRLKRTGTAFAAAVSTDDGATWTTIASGEISGFGNAPYYVGLVVCSRDPLARCTSQFDEVSITPT
ncbi:alginate lyase family protein [Streptomyces phaeochromogenes]|uniref:alginate lyase family protein n=1 Tax=Streptomyces phaeochromogenes TaxID=1923 RepID=UPI00368B4D33